MVTTSRNIQGNTELTLLAPLKPGLAPKNVGQPTDFSFPSRLSLLLATVFGDRKRELERDRIVEGLLEELQIIHSVQWVIIGETEPQLLLAVTFDGPWEPYIRTIVDRAGPLLDMIFSHCKDFEGNSCADGYQKFASWVRARQIPTAFLFGATSDLTTDDVRYLKQFEETFARDPERGDLAEVAARTRLEPMRRARSPRWHEKVIFLAQLGELFPDEQLRFARMSKLILLPELGVLSKPSPDDSEGQQFHQVFQLLSAPGSASALAMKWFEAVAQVPLTTPRDESRPSVEPRHDVQGSLLTPYETPEGAVTTHGCVALIRFRGPASGAAFLKQVQEVLTTEPPLPNQPIELDSTLVNLGLTFQGLQSLGLEPQLLASFPKEFQEGLERRAGMLGDIGRNHPEFWDLPRANWPDMNAEDEGEPIQLSIVDAVLVLQTRAEENSDHHLLPSLAVFLQSLAALVDVLHVQPTRRFSTKGHFNLEDGISQPKARGDASAAGALDRDQVALGELLLGYPNERGELCELEPKALFTNSTFLALRKIAQDVEAYRSIQPYDNELALGRRADGRALELEGLPASAKKPKDNDFNYPASPNESRCPHFAHVRRANPRTEPKPPRILRRGMSYGPTFETDAQAPRGLMFMAFAASLAEQYEVVQRWVNAGNSTGVLSSHPDLIAGPFPEGSQRHLYYSNALGTGQIPLPKRQPSVLSWGLYAFVPSRSALDWLAAAASRVRVQAAPPVPYTAPLDRGAAPNALSSPPSQAGAYAFEPDSPALKMKVFLEGGGSPTPEGAAYWRDVRAQGGARVTPFAVLVASQQAVQEVLLDPDRFSVRGYWARMNACRANSYLGMDPQPVALNDTYTSEVRPGDHERESAAANRFVGAITREQAFNPALAAGRRWLKEQPQLPGGQRLIDLFAYGRRIIRDVAKEIFALPEGFLSDADNHADPGGGVRCPFDLTTAFLHVFPPRPSKAVSDQAVEAGAAIRAAAEAFVSKPENRDELEKGAFIQALRQYNDYGDETEEARHERELRTLLGVLSGFAVPTNGHLVSVLVQLAGSGGLWRLQRELDPVLRRLKREAAVKGEVHEYAALSSEHVQFLYEPLYGCMIRAAVPERIQRTAVADTTLAGVEIKRGDLLAVSIASAAEEAQSRGESDSWKLLFGDLPGNQVATLSRPRHPVHACPAQDVAIGVLLGAITAMLEHRPLTPTQSPLVLVG